ncbi:hypothetical protein [Streptomyces sp. MMG1121]|uniref:hypothetical protein n=1 Tax=Streptomyces sp. MMG1121 TaxID=1415544 RepID=UPI0006AF423D|nr:hypothetical protein [Streptomyces sp. MMG1121]KOV65487.1 hypothetical protein ADK64_14480 [Streptomyces sp. MMG1121]
MSGAVAEGVRRADGRLANASGPHRDATDLAMLLRALGAPDHLAMAARLTDLVPAPNCPRSWSGCRGRG